MDKKTLRRHSAKNAEMAFLKNWSIEKRIFLATIFFSLLVITSSAMETQEFNVLLTDENSGTITIVFKLSEREYNLLMSDTEENIIRFKDEFGLTEDRTGRFSFIQPNLTKYEESPQRKILRFPGFYFDRYTWADMDWFFNSTRWKQVGTDYSPAVTRVIWPDNYEVVFEDLEYIPNMEHQISGHIE